MTRNLGLDSVSALCQCLSLDLLSLFKSSIVGPSMSGVGWRSENMGGKYLFLSILRVKHFLAYSSDQNICCFLFCSDVCSSKTVVSLRCIGKRFLASPPLLFSFSKGNTLYLQKCIPVSGEGVMGWDVSRASHPVRTPAPRKEHLSGIAMPCVQPRGREAAVLRGQTIPEADGAPLPSHPDGARGRVSPSLCLASPLVSGWKAPSLCPLSGMAQSCVHMGRHSSAVQCGEVNQPPGGPCDPGSCGHKTSRPGARPLQAPRGRGARRACRPRHPPAWRGLRPTPSSKP